MGRERYVSDEERARIRSAEAEGSEDEDGKGRLAEKIHFCIPGKERRARILRQ